MIIPNATIGLGTGGDPPVTQYAYAKASDGPGMTVAVEAQRAAIAAAFPLARIVSFEVAGAGAGAVYVTAIGFDATGAAAVNMPLLSGCVFRFVQAAEPAGLVTLTATTIAAQSTRKLFGQSTAGGGAGAVYLVGLAFATTVPTPGGGGGNLLQSCTTGMLEAQTLLGPGLTALDKEHATNPGVRMQCEFASVQPTSGIECTFITQTATLTVIGGGSSHGVIFRPRMAFPDDPLPTLRLTSTDVARNLGTQTSLPHGATAWSLIYPISALAAFGAPPAGRVQYFVEAATANSGDNVRIQGSPQGTNWGCCTMAMKEIANVSVQ